MSYLRKNTRLTVRIYSSVANVDCIAKCYARGIKDPRRIYEEEWEFIPGNAALAEDFDAPNQVPFDCEVFSAYITILTGTFKKGRIWTVMRIRGAYPELFQDYIYANHPAVYPTQRDALDGRGGIRTIVGTNQAAGAELEETVPANRRWQLLSFSAVFVAAAVAVDRVPRLVIDNGSTAQRRWMSIDDASNPIQTGETRTQLWQMARGARDARDELVDTQTLNIIHGLPENLFLEEGDRIRTVTENLNAGDDWAAPIFDVAEWMHV